MIEAIRKQTLLMIFFLLFAMLTAIVPNSFAGSIHHHPSKTKHIAVGTAVGAVGGALIGGRTGALVGAGAGAGAGYMVYRHKKHKYYRNRYRRSSKLNQIKLKPRRWARQLQVALAGSHGVVYLYLNFLGQVINR